MKKAERNIDELRDEEEDKRIKLDITKFVAERLGRFVEKKDVNVQGEVIDSENNLDDIVSEVLIRLKDKKFNGQKATDKTNGEKNILIWLDNNNIVTEDGKEIDFYNHRYL